MERCRRICRRCREYEMFSPLCPRVKLPVVKSVEDKPSLEAVPSAKTRMQQLPPTHGDDHVRVIANALKWIADHQLPDGSWNFDHTIGPGTHRASANAGHATKARNAATSMALLAFLASGETHLDGDHHKVVDAGIEFLIANQKPETVGGSFVEPQGNMYSHGLASMAICEAYAMTGDKELLKPAQAAIDYIVFAQDPVGGGWRYMAHQPGDTSVFGWQMAALKAANLADLTIPKETITKAMSYLNSVSTEDGTHYGYTSPGKGISTTSIGLLNRMEIGWNNHTALKAGMEFVAKRGPSLKDMYYNFYATQAMFYYHSTGKEVRGDAWVNWNTKLREFLINEQSQTDPATGSWHFPHAWGERGGRLYNTALVTLILGIYYRHLPRWRDPGRRF